jgi:membrane-bound lytic murein transglycosylase MltF
MAAALLWATLLPGCGGGPEEPAGPAKPAEVLTPTGVADEAPANEAPVAPEAPEIVLDNPWLRLDRVSRWTGDLDGMAERGVVRILTIHSRTNWFLDGGRERGLVVEHAANLETFLNERLKDQPGRLQVVLIPVRRDQLLPALVQGYGDAAAGNLTVTPEREAEVDFTDSHFEDVKELVVTGPDVPPVETARDLSGREIWVRRSSSYAQSLMELNESFRKVGRSGADVRWADENLEDEDILEMINAGLLPATVVDSHKLDILWAEVFDKLVINREASVRSGGRTATAIRKDSPLLEEALNDYYKRHGVGSWLTNTLLKRYYSKRHWLRNIGASSEMKKFDAVDKIFRKYATKYEFDYLMLMAQGYQESRLRQSARSHAGAVGIMQLLPSTASGPPVYIPDVENVDSNIHAGVKYLRFIEDHYFDDPEIDEVNRLLFAFASYNAGPNRIARIRRQAEGKGVDINRWFREVELEVEARVGQEPVTYVRNIYKYYLAYKELRRMAAAKEKARKGHLDEPAGTGD